MVLMLASGSHDEELAEETADASEAGEVVGVGAARVALYLVHGAEEGLAAMGGAVVNWQRRRRAGDGGGVREGGGGLRARAAIAEVSVGVGAEEGEDEEGG